MPWLTPQGDTPAAQRVPPAPTGSGHQPLKQAPCDNSRLRPCLSAQPGGDDVCSSLLHAEDHHGAGLLLLVPKRQAAAPRGAPAPPTPAVQGETGAEGGVERGVVVACAWWSMGPPAEGRSCGMATLQGTPPAPGSLP